MSSINNTLHARRALGTLMGTGLAISLAACGGSSSGGNGSSSAALPLSADTQFQAIKSVTHDLWHALNMQRYVAADAFDWLAAQCPDTSDLQEQDTTSRSITFTECRQESENNGSTWADRNTLIVNGSMTWQDDETLQHVITHSSNFSFLETGIYQEFDQDDISYHEEWQYGARTDGDFTFSTDQRYFSADQAHLVFIDNYHYTNNSGSEGENNDAEFRLADFQLESSSHITSSNNTFNGQGHVIHYIADDILSLDFIIATPLVSTSSSRPCFESGELLLTDNQNNALSAYFSGNEVTLTLNGVASTMSCAAFAAELDINDPPL